MTSKDINDYLDKGMYGSPQLKPDEQNKYLGTFRERVVFALTVQQMKNTKFYPFCLEKINTYPGGQLLINVSSDATSQQHFITLSQKTNLPFRLVDTTISSQQASDAIGVVYALDDAVHLDKITPEESTSLKKENLTKAPKTVEKKKKPSFFGKWL